MGNVSNQCCGEKDETDDIALTEVGRPREAVPPNLFLICEPCVQNCNRCDERCDNYYLFGHEKIEQLRQNESIRILGSHFMISIKTKPIPSILSYDVILVSKDYRELGRKSTNETEHFLSNKIVFKEKSRSRFEIIIDTGQIKSDLGSLIVIARFKEDMKSSVVQVGGMSPDDLLGEYVYKLRGDITEGDPIMLCMIHYSVDNRLWYFTPLGKHISSLGEMDTELMRSVHEVVEKEYAKSKVTRDAKLTRSPEAQSKLSDTNIYDDGKHIVFRGADSPAVVYRQYRSPGALESQVPFYGGKPSNLVSPSFYSPAPNSASTQQYPVSPSTRTQSTGIGRVIINTPTMKRQLPVNNQMFSHHADLRLSQNSADSGLHWRGEAK